METAVKYEVKEIVWPQRNFVIKRATVSFKKLSTFFAETYVAIYKAIKTAEKVSNEPPCAIYYSVDEMKMETDVAAAVPVRNIGNEVAGFEELTIPESKALQLTYYGSYQNMRPAYEALDRYVTDHKLQTQLMLEEYFSDPTVEKDPNKWKTNIYFLVK